MCSTPFGVIGLFTPMMTQRTIADWFVLNAVWRHWIVHDDLAELVGETAECSTPFGVIGLFTR